MPLPAPRDAGGQPCQLVNPRRPAGRDGFAGEVALDIVGQAAGRFIRAGRDLFSRALITIQSSSPRTRRANRAGSVWRCAEIDGRVARASLSRVLGFGGSSSRIWRMISA